MAKKTNPMAVPTYRAKPSKVQRVFWWTLPLALVMLVAGLKFVSMPLIASAANSSYSKGNYEQAERQWRALALFSVVERWKMPFGVGTAQLQQGNYAAAIRSLTWSYDSAPAVPADLSTVDTGTVIPRCDIQHNLALAYEGAADNAVAEGEAAVALMNAATDDFEKDEHRSAAIQAYDSAISGYEQAMTTRTLSSCADDQTAHDREQEKLAAAEAARKALDETSPPTDGTGGSDDQDNPNDSDNPGGSDDSGDSGGQGSSSDDPSQEPSDGSGDEPNSGSQPDDSETDDPSNGSGQGTPDDAPTTPNVSPQEQQRREELQKRQDEADREGEQMQQDYGPGNQPGNGSTGQGW